MTAIMAGSPARLGAHVDEGGVSFAVTAPAATRVELSLFDPEGRETRRVPLPGCTDGVWHGHVPGLSAGQLYGFRAHGPDDPAAGHRFDPAKLLLDPYARALHGRVTWDDALFAPPSAGAADTAPFMPKGIVTPPTRPVDRNTRPRRPLADTVIYEAHVKGLTALHPEVPDAERGTYDALGHPAVIAHLRRLGVTALELLPIQSFVDDRFLVRRGLTNYWGYSSLAFLAPEPRYLGPGGLDGLRRAVAALGAAGIEVILDIVFNHTAELEETGPTLSLRGLDHPGSYRLDPSYRRRTLNWTGCGNTLDFSRPAIVRLAVDAMRHWVEAYGIDGFRFDLAPVLGRDPEDFTPEAAFFAAVRAEPALADAKLIAEPWDVGPDGYRLGAFPPGWSEWCDVARDGIRAFWRGDRVGPSGIARALAGSREVIGDDGRGPAACVTYVTSHDGFTLADLVSFTERRNAANGEENRDGHGHNLSCNHGVEGPSDAPAILAARAGHVRALLASVLLARGVPMLLGGDELGRSQDGNNNAYCQDNDTTWTDWRAAADPDLADTVARLTAIRRDHPVLRRDAFYAESDVAWLRTDGRRLADGDWSGEGPAAFAMRIGAEPDLLLLLNATGLDTPFALPDVGVGGWSMLFSSRRTGGTPDREREGGVRRGTIIVGSRSLVLFRSTNLQDLG